MVGNKSDVYKNYVLPTGVGHSRVGHTGSRTPKARGGILDLYSITLATEQKSALRVADYKDILSRYGYRHVNALRYRVDVDAELRVPHIHRLPYYYKRLLAVLGVDLYAGAYFVPLLNVVKDKDTGKVVAEQGKVYWAGRYHPAYWYSHDLEYAERKVSELLSVVNQISSRLYGYREDNYNFDKETLDVAPRWEGVRKLKQNKFYVSRFLFTLPDKLSDFLMWLNVRHRGVYDKLVADLRQAVVRTVYRIMWYQLYRDAPSVAGERFSYRAFRDRYLVSFLMNMHIVHSFHYRDIDDVGDGDGGRGDVDVFSPHFHFHLLVLNVLYERDTGDFIRVDWFYGTAYELMREWWTREVLRVLRRYKDYLDAYDRRLYSYLRGTEFVVGVDKSWEVVEGNRDEIMHFIKYSHRPPLADIVLWFEMYNTKRDFEALLEKYDENWLRYVLEYVNRTYPYGIFSNWERYGLSVSDEDRRDMAEVDVNDDVIEKDVPYSFVFMFYLSDKDRILVEDRVGKSSRYWLYTRLRRPP